VVVLVLVLLLRGWNLPNSRTLAHLYWVTNCYYFIVGRINMEQGI